MKDYYRILEVEPDASQEEIKSQYRFLVQGFHPDKYASTESKAKAEEKLKQINEAFSVLGNPAKHTQYDFDRHLYKRNSEYQAQSEYERKQRERETKEKADAERRKREEAEAKKHEQEAKAQREAKEKAEYERNKRAEENQAARAKAQKEFEEKLKSQSASVQQPPASDRKPAIGVSASKNSLLSLWQTAGLVVLSCLALFLGWLGVRTFSTFTPIAPATIESTLQISTATTEAFFSTTETPRATATEIPFAVKDRLLAASEAKMVLIPDGEFIMGSDDDDKEASDNEKPLHKIILSSYYIDQYEVTNFAYKRCVDAGVCSLPTQSDSPSLYSNPELPIISSYYSNPEFNDYPVMYVNWSMANIYCTWRDARLPTEAEWEKAARGTNGYTYPWGNVGFDCSLANYFAQTPCVGNTTKVGSYESGKSPYGVYDMIGNVYEWVNDWYGETYYQNSPLINPLGIDSGNYRVLRGGLAGRGDGIPDNARSASRNWLPPNYAFALIGFRCARNP